MNTSNALKMVATHFNVTTEHKVTDKEVALALNSGTLKTIKSLKSQSIISFLFDEFSISLILKCIKQSCSNLEKANSLYKEIIHENGFVNEQWENFISNSK